MILPREHIKAREQRVRQRPRRSTLARAYAEQDLGSEQRVGRIKLALQRPRLKEPLDGVRGREPARSLALPENPLERARARHPSLAGCVLEQSLAQSAALPGSLGKQVDRDERTLGGAVQPAENPSDSLQRVGVKSRVPKRLPRPVGETQLYPHRVSLTRERDGLALFRLEVAVGGQRGFERGAGAPGHFQTVVKDTMPVGREEDPHSAPRTLKPAEKKPSPRARELPSEPADRVERRIERIGRQQLDLHTRAKGTTREHKAQRHHDQRGEQDTAEQREEIGPNRGRA